MNKQQRESVWGMVGAEDRLRELCGQKIRAVEIAGIISAEFAPVTKSAVIGKANRLKINNGEARGGVKAGTAAARRLSVLGVAAIKRKAAERRAAREVRREAKPSANVETRPKPPLRNQPQTKAEIRREFEDAWANTARMAVR